MFDVIQSCDPWSSLDHHNAHNAHSIFEYSVSVPLSVQITAGTARILPLLFALLLRECDSRARMALSRRRRGS